MSIRAGVGMSRHRNPRVAGREAAERALSAADLDQPAFVFLFATAGYDQATLLQTVRLATAGAPLCGCSGEGIIAGGLADESSFAVGVMVLSSDQLRFRHGVTPGLKAHPARVGQAIARSIYPDVAADTLALFLFPDGITVNFDQLMAGLEGHLRLERQLPVLGGTAADNMAGRTTFQYCDDQVISDGVAWALLSGRVQIAWEVNHGCMPVGVEYKVTRCQGNVIFEIDNRPALDILQEYLAEDELDDWAKTIMTFSFGLRAPGYMAGYDQYLIRGLVGGIDEVAGSITIPAEVPEGTSIWVTRRDYEKMAQGVDRIAAEIQSRLGEQPAKLVFQFDCAGRGKNFLRGPQRQQLLDRLRGPVGPEAPWLGFFTFGEIAPVGGYSCFHNYTVVLTVIY